MSKKKVERVDAKGIVIYESPMVVNGKSYPSYRITYYKEGRRVRERAGTLEEARKRSQELKAGLDDGTVHVGTLTAKQHAVVSEALQILKNAGGDTGLLDAVRQFAEAKQLLAGKGTLLEAVRVFLKELEKDKLPEICFPDLVEKFLVWVAAEKSRRYKLDMQARLHTAAKQFTGSIVEIKTADIDGWLSGMEGLSGRTKNNYRNAVRTVFGFAREKGYLPREAKTEAEFTSRYKLSKTEIGIYTPEQLKIFLSRIHPRMLPVVLLGAFAGMRASEISRLEWQHVRFEQNVIAVPAPIAKTAGRRLVPILPALGEWLRPFREEAGKVLVRVHDEFALASQFKAAVDAIKNEEGEPLVKIVTNGFRHSFVSYRVADIQNVPQAALEAGNSPRTIFSNYRELVVVEDAKKWFSSMPTKARQREIAATIAAGL